MRTRTFLPTSFAASATQTSYRRPCRPRGCGVVQADLDELQLGLRRPRRTARPVEVVELPLGDDGEMVEPWPSGVGSRKKRRCAASSISFSREPRRPGEEADHAVAAPRRGRPSSASSRGERPQASLGVDRGRGLGDDDSVAGARRALAGSGSRAAPRSRSAGSSRRGPAARSRRRTSWCGLARARSERLLDGGAVLRVRHVDEVDDDDPADVPQPQLAHDLLDGLEVVLRDRVLQPPPELFEREPTKRPVLTSMTVNASA